MNLLKKLLPKNELATFYLATFGIAIICRILGVEPLFNLAATAFVGLLTIATIAVSDAKSRGTKFK